MGLRGKQAKKRPGLALYLTVGGLGLVGVIQEFGWAVALMKAPFLLSELLQKTHFEFGSFRFVSHSARMRASS